MSTLPSAECVLVCILPEDKEQTFRLFSQASVKGVVLVMPRVHEPKSC